MQALKTDVGVIWDSLAILEYLAKHHPDAKLWPAKKKSSAAGAARPWRPGSRTYEVERISHG